MNITRYVVAPGEATNSLVEFSDGQTAICTENEYWIKGEPRSYKWMSTCPYGALIEDFRQGGEIKVTVGFNDEDAAKFADVAGYHPEEDEDED